MARVRDNDDDLSVSHEINITPFIDVVLVLLIIFMVAAPLSTVDVPVELPVAVAAPQPRPDKPVFLTIQADKTLSIGERTISNGTLISELDVATQTKRDTRLYVRADKDVPYGALMEVMNQLRTGGYLKVGLVGLESVGAAAASATSNSAVGQ